MNQNNQNQPQLREVNAGSNNQRWEPHKQNFDPNNPPRLAGYYKDEHERQGQNGMFTVVEVHTVNQDGSLGEIIDVAASAVLEDKLAGIALGSFIVIEFGGKVQPKKGGNAYNMWKVFVDDNALPYNQVGGQMGSKNVPHQNNNNGQQFNQNQNFNNNNGNGQNNQNWNRNNNGGNNNQFNGGNNFNQNNGGNNSQFNQNNGGNFQQNNGNNFQQNNQQQNNQQQNFNQNNQQNGGQNNGNGFKQYQGGDLPF